MYKITLFLLSVFMFLKLSAQHDHFWRTDVFGDARLIFNIAYENQVSSYSTLGISFEAGRYFKAEKTEFGEKLWERKLTGWAVTPEYRYYLRARKYSLEPVGIFAGSYFRFMKHSYEKDWFSEPSIVDSSHTENASSFGLGVLLGYKYKRPDSPFFAETLVGIGFGGSSLTAWEGEIFPNEMITSRFEISIGWSF